MSHVVNIDLQIKDLNALKKACAMLGLEFRENQKNYRWFGRSVGDYKLPQGFTAADLGHCEHAIAVKGNPNAYEIGVVKRRDGKPGYILQWDFWQGGYGLENAVGKNGVKLQNSYSEAVSLQRVRKEGFRVQRTVTPSGKIILRATR